MEANAFSILLNVMWLFSLYRRVLYFWIAYSQVRANLYDNIFFSERHNSNMMYIYKRPYVHFPTIFLRQNCDHMCIIKIVFNPLPMKIFWKKKLALYIQFLKDKESALYFVEVSILYKTIYVDPLLFSAENEWTMLSPSIEHVRDFLLEVCRRKSFFWAQYWI